MKHLLLLFCLLLALKTTYAQDTLYYYENGCLAPTAEGAHSKEIIIKENHNDSTATVLEFFISGAKKSETHYSNYANRTKSKQYKQWYENGQIKIIANYTNNKLNGEVFTYWEDGSPKREDTYNNNVLVNGKCWDKNGNEIPHFVFWTKPQPLFNVLEHIKKNIKYPQKAIDAKQDGRIDTRFTVSKDGNLCNFRTIGKTNKHLAAESIRVLQAMPKWEPATCDGEVISSEFKYPMSFSLGQ